MLRAGGGGRLAARLDRCRRACCASDDRPRRCSTLYQVWDDPVSPTASRSARLPTASVELRWPLVRTTGRADARDRADRPGRSTPTTLGDQDDIPNEDSQLPEFDETNLFSLNRFPGLDRLETGLRANLGVSYTRYDPAGWSLGLTLGRVLRAEPDAGVRRGHRPRRALVGLRRRGVARLRLGPRRWSTARSSTRASTSAATSSRSPTTASAAALRAAYVYLAEDDSEPDPRAAAGDQRVRARRPLPGPPELGAARPLALRRRDQQQPARRRRHHLRQRVRRVRPFGLAPLYLIV